MSKQKPQSPPPLRSGKRLTAAKGSRTSKPPASSSAAISKGSRASAGAVPSKQPASEGAPEAKKAVASTPNALPATALFAELQKAHPDAHCELDHASPFQLLVATVLSAQSTDVAVNLVTNALFHQYPDAARLAQADATQVETLLNRIGMYRQKTKNIIGLSLRLVNEHRGQVPQTLAELVELPGVGRKTANVVLGVAFGQPEGVVVDTHVMRLAQRLGWSQHQTPEKIEAELMRTFPASDWDSLSHTLIFHGRRVCAARKPACAACSIHNSCPSAFHAEDVGRKVNTATRSRALQATGASNSKTASKSKAAAKQKTRSIET